MTSQDSPRLTYQQQYRVLHIQAFLSAIGVVLCLALGCFLISSHLSIARVIEAWLLSEAVFYIWFRRHTAHISRQPCPHAPKLDAPLAKFRQFVIDAPQISKYTSLERCISRWFGDVPSELIKRENIGELFAYGFWYRTRHEMKQAGLSHIIEEIPTLLEQSWGLSFSEGYNPDISFNAHLWQPLRFWYRPFCFYLCMEFIGLLRHVCMLSSGFQAHRLHGFVYYTYGMDLSVPGMAGSTANTDDGPSQIPIFFLHGVGAGLFPYVGFINRLAATGHPVVAIEVRHLSMRLCKEIPDCDTVARTCLAIMDHHSIPTVNICSHSFGTFIASRILQRAPRRIKGFCLIDPVCFLLFTGQLVNNFVYRPELLELGKRFAVCARSARGQWLRCIKELCSCALAMLAAVPSCFISRELHCAASVARRFYWSTLNLAPEQLPDATVVALSGNDMVTPTSEIKSMLEFSGLPAKILYQASHKHAEFLVHGAWQDRIVHDMLDAAGSPMEQVSPARKHPIRVHAYSDSASSLTYKGL